MPVSGRALESDRLRPALERLGIDAGWSIVVPDDPDPVEMTAARQMRRLLGKAFLDAPVVPESGSPGVRRILLGRAGSLRAIGRLDRAGLLRIGDVSPQDDGFHVRRIGTDIAVAGANPRGVLHGVFALEEYIARGQETPLDIRRIPWFRRRGNSAGQYDFHVNISTGGFTEETAEYLARMGVNQYVGSDAAIGVSHLHQLVRSGVFSFQAPPDENVRQNVRKISSLCRRYGIAYYYMLWEPITPQIAADPALYPPEALGRVRRPWGGDRDGMDRTLCVMSPPVREHYRDLMGKFVREFPDVAGVWFYNLDGSTWLCTPELCPRCAEAVRDSPRDRHNPWETQADLVTLLAGAAREQRPDFEFVFWGGVHYHGEGLRKLLANAGGCGGFLIAWDGSDSDVMIPGVKVPCAEFETTREAARSARIPLCVLHSTTYSECVQKAFPYPFHVCGALKKLKSWGVRGQWDGYGSVPAFNSVNMLALREFQRDPDRDPAPFLRDLAVRQYGPNAGRLMFAAWEEIRGAMDAWNGYRLHPLSGSQMFLSIGTMYGLPPAILPGIETWFDEEINIRVRVEPWRAADYARFREQRFAGDYARMTACLQRAAKFAFLAAAEAPDNESIDLLCYEGSPEGMGRPTRREYAELSHAAIAIAASVARQRLHMLRAVRLQNDLKARRAAGGARDAGNVRARYRELLRDDLALQGEFAGLLEHLLLRRPCLVRTGLTAPEIGTMIRETREKAGRLRTYIASDRETE